MSGTENTSTDKFIRCICFINSIPLIAIIDMGATYSFISLDCANRLELNLSFMVGSMAIDTPSNCSITTSLVCLEYPLTIYGKSFAINLVCLQVSQLECYSWNELVGVQLCSYQLFFQDCDVSRDGRRWRVDVYIC